jgi:MFS family permease
MFFGICTGINTIIYYAPTIFQLVGLGDNISALYATIGIGVINFAMTVVALVYIDRFGRKPLLYIGLSGMLISLSVLSGALMFGAAGKWPAVMAVITYIASYAISFGPVCCLMVSEIMPLQIRGIAMSVATVANFAFNFVVVLSFLPLVQTFGTAPTFLLFAFVTLLSLFFVYFYIPETKGLSLEKIEANWRKTSS